METFGFSKTHFDISGYIIMFGFGGQWAAQLSIAYETESLARSRGETLNLQRPEILVTVIPPKHSTKFGH